MQVPITDVSNLPGNCISLHDGDKNTLMNSSKGSIYFFFLLSFTCGTSYWGHQFDEMDHKAKSQIFTNHKLKISTMAVCGQSINCERNFVH